MAFTTINNRFVNAFAPRSTPFGSAAIDELRFDFTDLDQRKPHNAEQTPADMSGPDLQPIKKKKKGGRPKKDSTVTKSGTCANKDCDTTEDTTWTKGFCSSCYRRNLRAKKKKDREPQKAGEIAARTSTASTTKSHEPTYTPNMSDDEDDFENGRSGVDESAGDQVLNLFQARQTARSSTSGVGSGRHDNSSLEHTPVGSPSPAFNNNNSNGVKVPHVIKRESVERLGRGVGGFSREQEPDTSEFNEAEEHEVGNSQRVRGWSQVNDEDDEDEQEATRRQKLRKLNDSTAVDASGGDVQQDLVNGIFPSAAGTGSVSGVPRSVTPDSPDVSTLHETNTTGQEVPVRASSNASEGKEVEDNTMLGDLTTYLETTKSVHDQALLSFEQQVHAQIHTFRTSQNAKAAATSTKLAELTTKVQALQSSHDTHAAASAEFQAKYNTQLKAFTTQTEVLRTISTKLDEERAAKAAVQRECDAERAAKELAQQEQKDAERWWEDACGRVEREKKAVEDAKDALEAEKDERIAELQGKIDGIQRMLGL